MYCYAGPRPHTASTAATGTHLSGSPRTAQDGLAADTGILFGEDSWLARGSEATYSTDTRLTQRGTKTVKGLAQLP